MERKAQWITPLGVQLIPGFFLFIGMLFFCPESPRWLARGDRFDEAEKILSKLRGLPADHVYIRREMGEIREQVEFRSANRVGKKAEFLKLFAPGTRNRMALGVSLMFMQSYTG